jgi:hypothetical protein
MAGRAGNAEGVDQEDVLAGGAAGAGGDGVILALEVEHKGGTGVVE